MHYCIPTPRTLLSLKSLKFIVHSGRNISTSAGISFKFNGPRSFHVQHPLEIGKCLHANITSLLQVNIFLRKQLVRVADTSTLYQGVQITYTSEVGSQEYTLVLCPIIWWSKDSFLQHDAVRVAKPYPFIEKPASYKWVGIRRYRSMMANEHRVL